MKNATVEEKLDWLKGVHENTIDQINAAIQQMGARIAALERSQKSPS